MSVPEIVAISLGALGAGLGGLSLWLDMQILRRHDHHHHLIRELHEHHLGGNNETQD